MIFKSNKTATPVSRNGSRLINLSGRDLFHQKSHPPKQGRMNSFLLQRRGRYDSDVMISALGEW